MPQNVQRLTRAEWRDDEDAERDRAAQAKSARRPGISFPQPTRLTDYGSRE